MKAKHLIIYGLIFIFVNVVTTDKVYSQKNNKVPLSKRLYFGGNFGLTFGNITSIYIAPVGIYAVTEKFHVGLGASYQYLSNRNYVPKVDVSTYGGSIFARYFLFDEFFAHAEYEKLFYKDSYSSQGNYPVYSIDGFYVGGGYRSWIGQNAFMTVLVLFDLTQDYIDFGRNPFIRIGMGFGL